MVMSQQNLNQRLNDFIVQNHFEQTIIYNNAELLYEMASSAKQILEPFFKEQNTTLYRLPKLIYKKNLK